MTITQPELDTPPAPINSEPEGVCHLVCQGNVEIIERTVPMYAACGVDITFDEELDGLHSKVEMCEECQWAMKIHMLICTGPTCRIPIGV